MNPQATISWDPENYSTDDLAIAIGIIGRDRGIAIAEAAAPYNEQIALFAYELDRRAPKIEVTT